jgi:hypothetical protein
MRDRVAERELEGSTAKALIALSKGLKGSQTKSLSITKGLSPDDWTVKLFAVVLSTPVSASGHIQWAKIQRDHFPNETRHALRGAYSRGLQRLKSGKGGMLAHHTLTLAQQLLCILQGISPKVSKISSNHNHKQGVLTALGDVNSLYLRLQHPPQAIKKQRQHDLKY